MTEPVLNPVADVPLLGSLFGKLDEAVSQIGFPLWFRALLELVLTGILCFYLLRLAATRLLPWAAHALVGPFCVVVDAFRAVLLLPDLAVSTAMRRAGRMPPEPVHTYGAVVMTVTDGLQDAVRFTVPKLAGARRANKLVLIVLLVAGFLVWNSQTCADQPCVSPVTAWTNSLDTWFGSSS